MPTYTGHPLDYFHVNSIDLTIDGSLLVSARNTWGVYKVSRKTGEVLWRLGGRRSDFEMGKGTVFAWQHDARHHGNGLISIFDDGAAPQVEPQSRVLVIRLDGTRGRATLVRKYTHRPGRIVTKFMGNAQVLGNGNVVVGWGSEPFVTEFAPDGTILLDLKLPHGGQNYRAFRFPWVGRPRHPPGARLPLGTRRPQAVRQLERRDRGRCLAAARRPHRRGARRGRQADETGVRDGVRGAAGDAFCCRGRARPARQPPRPLEDDPHLTNRWPMR